MNILNLINELKVSLKRASEKFRNSLGLKFDIPEVSIEIPAQSIHGELSTNISMVCSKLFKMPPIKIANYIVENIDKNKCVKKCEVAGAGFINFFLEDNFFSDTLNEINSDYGKINYGCNKKVLVEFISSNPTGPMHIGNARLGALGDSLSEILKYAGYDVSTEFYVNDAGNQIKKFSESLSSRYIQIFDKNEVFPEDGYHGNDIKELAQKFADIHGDSFLSKDRAELQSKICDFALPMNIQRIKENLSNYKIFYDNWFHESDLYKSGEIDKTINLLKSKNATYVKDDALWFKATDFGCDKDEVLIRNNKIPTYFAADIAYHANKFFTRKFDICIDFLGADHHGHTPRMHAAMECLGIDKSRLIFIISQFVRLVRNGKVDSMSKRSGNAETLEDFMKIVNVDCARFIFNMQDANSTMDFDIDLAVKNDNSNPSYYVKYAYARIRSILKKIEDVDLSNLDLNLLDSESERKLIFLLSEFPLEIEESARLLDSTRIVKYVIKVASFFHKFYNENKVNCDNKKLREARYYLCLKTSIVIENILRMMKVDVPEYM